MVNDPGVALLVATGVHVSMAAFDIRGFDEDEFLASAGRCSSGWCRPRAGDGDRAERRTGLTPTATRAAGTKAARSSSPADWAGRWCLYIFKRTQRLVPLPGYCQRTRMDLLPVAAATSVMVALLAPAKPCFARKTTAD